MICEKILDCANSFSHTKKTLNDISGGKSTFIIENNSSSNYEIIDFENCVYEGKENETKCDFGLATDDTIYFIELKGNDLRKGCDQLRMTINATKKCFDDKEIEARLVVSKVNQPKMYKNTPNYKRLIKAIGI